MRQFWYFMICVPLWGKAQENLEVLASRLDNIADNSSRSSLLRVKGIQWAERLTYKDVQEKAKKEHKYIFLDCYATWCAPCKDMDRNVYVNDEVGDFFNKHFISVKVQMNRTNSDNENIKRWYDDAAAISKKYRIDGLPGFIFLSPEGVLLQQHMGYKKESEFLLLARSVIKQENVYKGLYEEYDYLVAEFKKGVKHYDSMVYMIRIAKKFDTALARSLIKIYGDYISQLDVAKRYTRNNIEFWNEDILKSGSREFQYFYTDSKLIDRVMSEIGYSSAVIEKTIYHENILPFFDEQNTNKVIPMSGMYLSGSLLKTDIVEADWKKLYLDIRSKYNSKLAKKNVLAAKIEWYKRHWNYQAYCVAMLNKLKKYPPVLKREVDYINSAAWNAFLHVTDKDVLNSYVGWMEKVVAYRPRHGYLLDTYAALLYKIGKKQEAIAWEEKAMQSGDSSADAFRSTWEKMKRGEAIN